MNTGAPPLSGTPKPQAKALNCPKCGAAITLRSFGQAETVVCGSCHAILDAKDPNLAILQQFEAATGEVKPLIPLGTRGKLRGTDYEVIGFQRRSTEVTDFVHPPRVLSSEKLQNEVTWSIGEYMYGREVWDAFQLPGAPPEAMGVYENQPSPATTKVTGVWVAFAAFAVFLLALMAGFDMRAKKEPVLHETYQYNRAESKSEPPFVTDVFELTGDPSTVEVKTYAPVSN